MASISGLSFAFPKNKVFQEEIKAIGRRLFSSKINFEKIAKVYDNSGVKTRFLVEELSWYIKEHNWSERNFLFKKNALCLLKKSISETIEKTKTQPEILLRTSSEGTKATLDKTQNKQNTQKQNTTAKKNKTNHK